MKNLLIVTSILIVAVIALWYFSRRPSIVATTSAGVNVPLQDGDIIFQESKSSQSQAIQLATHSKYSHCGVVFWNHGRCFVFEAVKQVSATPLDVFLEHGEGHHAVVKRLKNSAQAFQSIAVLQTMADIGKQKYLGKPYDIYFEWSDENIYCSELVWKLYKEGANIELGKLQRLGDFDLSSPVVKQKLEERYGKNIPVDEQVISPAAIFDSEQLVTVAEY